ncbi:MAG: ABC transporter permease [Archangium sp.]|nr:ABC transporter permease [Archangium sp.]
MFSKALVLVRIAFANIKSSMLNVFVGLVLLFGAALLVVGGSIFSTLDEALSKSIIGSITGHMQVYGASSKDGLEIYGRVDGTDSSLAPIDDFKAVKAKLLSVPNVARVVPMGAATSILSSGNTVDVTLEKLRRLISEQNEEATKKPAAEFETRKQSLISHVRNMVAVLSKDLEREKELTAEKDLDLQAREVLAKAGSDEFWAGFDADPFGHLELLENRLAPIVSDSDMLFIRYLGTDLDAYQETFDRMTVVEGTKVPSGHRGILLPRFFTEELLKLKNARRLDKIRDARAAGRTLSDESDKELQRFVKENQAQTREIVLQLDGLGTQSAIGKLQGFLGSKEPDLAKLLTDFFSVTDDNFEARYAFFYKELAPMLSLYRVKVGDTMTLRSFGRSGSLQTALVKVYGVFELKGLEKSPLAGANALVDMITFRELYGFLTNEKKAEQDAMKKETGAKQIDRETAEADLFGGDEEVVQEVTAKAFDDGFSGKDGPTAKARRLGETFSLEEIDDGVVMHAAVLLKDGSEVAQLRTQEEIEKLLSVDAPPPDAARTAAAKALVDEGKLPGMLGFALGEVVKLEEARLKGEFKPSVAALLALKDALKAERPTLEHAQIAPIEALLDGAKPKTLVVGWSSAAGFLGKFIDFFRLLLVAIVSAFAFFALIVVTIGMTIATLQRTTTIGTMRAIGAQRPFVLGMVMMETVMLALSFGAVGAGLGALVVRWLHFRGIPAFRDELYFFFSGPVLRPELTASGIVLAVFVTLVVSVIAVIFPLVLATRIQPIVAMQASES